MRAHPYDKGTRVGDSEGLGVLVVVELGGERAQTREAGKGDLRKEESEEMRSVSEDVRPEFHHSVRK